MSRKRNPADLLEDDGVLGKAPLLEIFHWRAVAARGGLAVLPLRSEWLDALAEGVEAVSLPEKIGDISFAQAVVHLQKGRAATAEGLHAAWNALLPGGRLFLPGSNELGIKTAVKNLARDLGQNPEILANRAHSRVAVFHKTGEKGPDMPIIESFEVESGGSSIEIETRPGVFSAGRVDGGSRLILDRLPSLDTPATILDLGCGGGVLGLAAALHWPDARLISADHDRRALDAVEANIRSFGLQKRSKTVWWDALREDLGEVKADLVLVNPPFHRGKAVDLDIPRAFIRTMKRSLTRGGMALIVANNTLPYEHELERIGRYRIIFEDRGYKLLSFTHGAGV